MTFMSCWWVLIVIIIIIIVIEGRIILYFLYKSVRKCTKVKMLSYQRLDGYSHLTRCIPQDQCETQKVLPSTLGFCCLIRILFFGLFLVTLESSSSNMDLEYRLWSKKHEHVMLWIH